jgi:hypothetical protein
LLLSRHRNAFDRAACALTDNPAAAAQLSSKTIVKARAACSHDIQQ